MFEQFKYNLQHNRKSVLKTVTATLIFGAIILVFALFGLTPRNQQGMQNGSVAVVNGEQVSMIEMSEMVDRMKRDPRFQQFASLGGDFGTKFLEQQAMSQLIELKLLNQKAEEERFWTPDAQVRDAIVAIPAFQEQGRFKAELYHSYLAMIRKTPGEFEKDMRSEMAIGRAAEMFKVALQPLPAELEKEKALHDMKANLEFLAIPTMNLVSKDKVPQADVDKFLADKANDTKIKNYFDSHKETFSTQETVHARHILIPTEGADAAADQKALDLAKKVATRAKNKEDFAKLAKEFSGDPGSKAKGGDLGSFTKGQMVPEFDKVAFSAPIGEISEPVKSQFGYHIIQVQERKSAQSRTMEQARPEIARSVLAEEKSHQAVEAADAALKSGNSNALNQFASEHGLKWQETGAFAVDAETVPKIGNSSEAVKTAFQLSNAKPLATSLIRQGGTAYAIRYKSVPPETKAEAKKDAKSAEQSPEVLAAMTANRRSEDALRQWVESIRKTSKIETNGKYAATGGEAPQEE
jgi:peptidyl-prolyl cis-trans isomerase D